MITKFFSHLTWIGFNPETAKWKVSASLIKDFSSVKNYLKKINSVPFFKHHVYLYFKERLYLGLLIIFLTYSFHHISEYLWTKFLSLHQWRLLVEFHSRGKINVSLGKGQHKKHFSSAKENKEFPPIWFLPSRWQTLVGRTGTVESCKCFQTLLGSNWPPYSLPAITNTGQNFHYMTAWGWQIVLFFTFKLCPTHGLYQHEAIK